MPSIIRKEKITCEQVTRNNIVRHKKRCSAGTLFCTQCPNFSTKSRDDLNYHIAKKHSVPRSSIIYKCKLCHAEFPGFYALRQHKNTQHGTQIGFVASNIDVEDIVGDVDDQSLREELESCKHFLTDTELVNGRHRVFNFAMSSFDISLLNDKLDYVLKELKCAAKINIAFGFVLKNNEDGICRYFYAHKNNTIMEKSKLVCTPDDKVNLKEKLQRMDIIDLCTRERANTKWKFYKLTNVTVFAALLKDIPMGCKDTVLPEPLLRNCNVNCLTFERNSSQPYIDNLCFFRAVALHLFGNERLEEETSKIFNLFLNICGEGDPSKFQGVHMTDIPKVEDLTQLNIFLYDIDFVDGDLIGELCRRSIQKYEKSVKLLRYNNHTCYVNNINALFKAFDVLRVTHFSQRRGIWNDIWLLVVIALNIFTPRMFTNWEKRFLKSWMHSISHIKTSKTVQELGNFWFWIYLCQGRLLQANWDNNMDREACSYISFHLVKLDLGNHFSLQRQSSSSYLVFYYCSRRISNSEQSSDEIAFYWSRDCNQDKTVCCTGTTQPRTEPSVDFCRWLYRGGGRKGFIYTIPPNAKQSINWLTGTFWALL